MRFWRGTKIEVLCKKEVPSGAWRSAEIIFGNGHYYTIRYAGSREVERVSRKFIRPCPLVDITENLDLDDVIEVYVNFSWKMAKISKVLGEDYFLVRLLGSSCEFEVSKTDIRMRQSWQNDEWLVIGKDSGSCGEGKYNENSALERKATFSPQIQKRLRIHLNLKTGQIHLKDEENDKKSHSSSIRTSKKRYGSEVNAYDGAPQKYRTVEKNGMLDPVPSALPNKVETVALPRQMVGEENKHASEEKRASGSFEVDIEKRKEASDIGCCFEGNPESDDTESVSSCSINGSYIFCDYVDHCSSGSIRVTDGDCCDAESSTEEDDFEAEIHRFELHAYHSTIVALHALGPLNWEKEALISNLRLYLNISDDEHLMELRNLLPSGKSIRAGTQLLTRKHDNGCSKASGRYASITGGQGSINQLFGGATMNNPVNQIVFFG